ncbi:antizyme inhibitor 2 isoform X3 [Tympanuchus pallidicinctus]|uniref:antizyme inhibitor 2 isoform X3 n=1 Tax=Tympanuchus pallidicinctus TaxID=109042 RepID=UPI0022870A52|nr:antizyme inhibitor 2 isoform X3 [Tympanuchus pallidicinctus]
MEPFPSARMQAKADTGHLHVWQGWLCCWETLAAARQRAESVPDISLPTSPGQHPYQAGAAQLLSAQSLVALEAVLQRYFWHSSPQGSPRTRCTRSHKHPQSRAGLQAGSQLCAARLGMSDQLPGTRVLQIEEPEPLEEASRWCCHTLTMNGYLNESNFTMVEEGFTSRDLLESTLLELCRAGDRQAFFVADLGDIVKKHVRFLKALPRVKPYFPVRCNSGGAVIRLLAELGAGFACANKTEIAEVQSIGVPADRIFYSSPCKQVAHVKYAASHGVQLMTFDNEVELSKVARSHPQARMLLGIAADPSPSAHPSMMFGATLKSCRRLLESAKEQDVEVVGISFHLGSHSLEPQVFAQAVAEARLAFDVGTELGYRMHLLDIGGGFPGTEDTRAQFEEIAAVINSALDMYFPEGCGVEIVATPGRYYVTSAFTFAASITGKEEVPMEQPGSDESGSKRSLVYHLSDGIYGTFSCVLFDSPCPKPLLHKKPCQEHLLCSSSLRGPLGHAEDQITNDAELPELQDGDWLIFQDMGAYTIATSSLCSGCPRPHVTYAMSRLAWKALQLLQGKPPPAEDDHESACTPLSCGWEMVESLCVPPVFTPASII